MADLQTFGGNTFANMWRGGGVLYREILCDVCDKCKVNYNQASSTPGIETGPFMKLLADSFDKSCKECDIFEELQRVVAKITKMIKGWCLVFYALKGGVNPQIVTLNRYNPFVLNSQWRFPWLKVLRCLALVRWGSLKKSP
ncbi:hypothetical protein [Helicobacter gastrocanis]|uniref:hypothetical protein n=1 Tax=Helicobacter gastrocanis TaxID=2849641 RepID=UPI001C863C2B|nr:hypothetical protein [Helicobacter sp. NHP19-003]